MIQMGDEKELLTEIHAVKNLLIVQMLGSGFSPEAIELATGMNTKTIRNTFPIKVIKKNMQKVNSDE